MTNYGMPFTNGDRQPQIPASVAESLLDAERIAELVHQAELQDIATTAEQRIREVTAKDGHEQTVGGVLLRVSNGFVAGKAQDGTSVYARLYATRDTDEPTRCGILFDVTPDKAVVTTNLDGISVIGGAIVVGSDFNAGIEVDPKDEVYQYVAAVVDTIWTDVTQRERREIEEKQYAETREKREKQWRRDRRRQEIRDIFREMGDILVPAALVGGTVGAGVTILALIAADLPEITDEAAVIPVSGQASPTFSGQLYSDDSLESSDIYNILTNSFDQGDVREFVLESSKPGKNCVVKVFDEESSPSLTSEIKAWTDAVNPDGTPRNNEITVTYTLDELKACWVKDTQKDEDDTVRVVVQLTDPAEAAQ